jgi:ferric-dicitrate binding protein FerR (iron transport regulator)
MFTDKKQHLLHLIEKFQSGNASEKEISYLVNFFSSHQNAKDWPLAPELKNEIKELVFDKIKTGIEPSKKKPAVIPLNVKKVLQYAAILTILAATGYYLSTFNRFSNSVNEQPVVIENNIEIGTDKATLTLEDGQQVALEKGTEFVTNTAKSDGEKLIYEKSETTKAAEPKIAYNYLTIPRGGKFYIELADGTKVWLNSESKLKYPVAFLKGKPREIELIYGEAFLSVSPSTMHNGDAFRVITSNQSIEVLGTEFNIKAYQNDNYIATTLVEGKVAVTSENRTETLLPSQQSTFNLENKTFEIKTVDTAIETAWLKGYFSFSEMEFAEVAKVLSRWYNVEFNFENQALAQLKINGVLSKDQNIEFILITLQNLENIDYKITENVIIIK